jgi:proteic killer suppression protein
MIISWLHQGLRDFSETGSTKGIQVKHKDTLRKQLSVLNTVSCPEDIAIPNWRSHKIKGRLQGHYAISVSGNWQLIFKFDGEDVILMDYRDLSLNS